MFYFIVFQFCIIYYFSICHIHSSCYILPRVFPILSSSSETCCSLVFGPLSIINWCRSSCQVDMPNCSQRSPVHSLQSSVFSAQSSVFGLRSPVSCLLLISIFLYKLRYTKRHYLSFKIKKRCFERFCSFKNPFYVNIDGKTYYMLKI